MNKKYLFALVAATVLLGGCGKKPDEAGKAAVSAGPTVKFRYSLKVDGKTMDSSDGKEPVSVTLGGHHLIPGLEEALAGMKAGEKRSITVAPDKGYGAYHPDWVKKFPKAVFKDITGLKPGMVVNGHDKSGRSFQARVKDVDAKNVTLDLNHPLAGKTLSFDIEVVSVQAAGA
jgi:FKBP-type peptidyl-prolyl cis-trans isomerase 2